MKIGFGLEKSNLVKTINMDGQTKRGLLISAHRRGSLVDLWVRTEDNQKRQITVTDFEPYFYVQGDYGEFKGIYGESLTKIITKDPSQVRKERENYKQSWEADIPYVRRVLIDLGIYKYIYIDDKKIKGKFSPIYLSIKDIKLVDEND